MVLPMLPPYGNWLNYKIHNMLTIGMFLRWILSTPVQFIVGKRFYVGSYHALRRRSANMDVLVALGTNAAYFYSIYILIKALTSVVAKGKTLDALAKLTQLVLDKVCLLALDAEGNVISETEVDTQLIQGNDIIKIVPGAKIPVDVVKATHVGTETAPSQIVQLVEAAQLAKAPIQKLADHISKFFVPIVVVAAFITWLGWFILGEAGIYPKYWIPKAMDAFEDAFQRLNF
ncbi:hypothetical protein K1719_003372 [Acacia pycnantha]|nr:hypothetical protein K1719_003372 [Acacia pycnantha]